LRWTFKLFLGLVFLTGLQVGLLRFVNPPFTAFSAWKWLRSKSGTVYFQLPDHRWRKLQEISPHLLKAVLAGEDQRFLKHRGFDFIEINHALRDILRAGKVRGASTITMQVARIVFLWPDRNWLRKLAEAYYTVFIETLWSKRRILEVYLNMVDWGPGVMGVDAASRRYFNRHPAAVTPQQAALMAAILPSPHKWSPTHPSEYVMERQRRILKDMESMPALM
jgi:monofunctional biosynthetic peptidoglycan transglycosylase